MPLDTPVPAANLKLAAQAVAANVLLRELIVAAITFWAYFWFALRVSRATDRECNCPIPASIAFGHPNTDLSGIFLKPFYLIIPWLKCELKTIDDRITYFHFSAFSFTLICSKHYFRVFGNNPQFYKPTIRCCACSVQNCLAISVEKY